MHAARTINDWYTLLDSQLNIIDINDAGLTYFSEHTKKRDLIGKNMAELFPNLIRSGWYKKLVTVIQTGEPYFKDNIIATNERMGNKYYLNVKAFKVDNCLCITATNLSMQKEMEMELMSVQEYLDKHIKEHTAYLEQKILGSIKVLVQPFLKKLKKTRLTIMQKHYVNMLEDGLTDVMSPFVRKLSSEYFNLSSTEIQIANLIMQGRSTKEIAECMKLSDKTVESHRKRIRKKMGITHKKVNLSNYLQQFHVG